MLHTIESLLASERLQHEQVQIVSHPSRVGLPSVRGYRLEVLDRLLVKDLDRETLIGLIATANRGFATLNLIKDIQDIIRSTIRRALGHVSRTDNRRWVGFLKELDSDGEPVYEKGHGGMEVAVSEFHLGPTFDRDRVWSSARHLMFCQGWNYLGVNDISSCDVLRISLDLYTGVRRSGESEYIIPKHPWRDVQRAESHGHRASSTHDCIVKRCLGALGRCKVHRRLPTHYSARSHHSERIFGRYRGMDVMICLSNGYDDCDYHSAVVFRPDVKAGLDSWFLPGVFLNLPVEVSFLIWSYAGVGGRFNIIDLVRRVVSRCEIRISNLGVNQKLSIGVDGVEINGRLERWG